MFRRYQVRIRRCDEFHAFAVRLNATRAEPPDPSAQRYSIAIRMAMLRPGASARNLQPYTHALGATERS